MSSDSRRTRTVLPYNVLVWLAVALFSTGIDGYVLTGLLPTIATSLHVGDAAAGQLVTVFALTSAIGAPLLGAVTSGWEQRRSILLALAVFVAGNLVTALAPTYAIALAGRIVAALGACLLAATISGYVIHVAPEHQRGRALSFVLGGWMTATALGVPVGLMLGQSSWRLPLIMVAAVGSVAFVGILVKLPRLRLAHRTIRERIRPLRQPRLVAGLLVTTGILCASYTCFTYSVLILERSLGSGWVIVLVMFGYGLASMLGNMVSGGLADRYPPGRVLTLTLLGLLCVGVVGVVAFALPAGPNVAVLGLIWFLAAGIGNGGAAVPQQARLAAMAPHSASVVMALNGSAISLGAALGGALGGLALTAGVRPGGLPIVAVAVLVATLALHVSVAVVERPAGCR
ncbi:MAG TPA: MFS transporter [Microbacteriaceae bacterium]